MILCPFSFFTGAKKQLEHLGTTRDRRVPNWFFGVDGQSATEKYNADMEWKRALH
jgi:hypothetical protein